MLFVQLSTIDTRLNIGSYIAQCKPDFEFLKAGTLFTDTASELFV